MGTIMRYTLPPFPANRFPHTHGTGTLMPATTGRTRDAEDLRLECLRSGIRFEYTSATQDATE